jgi:TonB family protein
MSSICLQFLAHLADISIRALCLGAFAWLVMVVGRVRGPAARHAMWSAVLAGMMSLPLLVALLPSLPIRVAALHAIQPVRADFVGSSANARVASRVPAVRPAVPLPPPPRWPVLVAGIYLAAALILLGRFSYGYRKSRRLAGYAATVHDNRAIAMLEQLASAQSMGWPLPQLRASRSVLVPLTLGWREPIILFPQDWEIWDDWKLRAVMSHELAHIRRADWLVAIAASLNRCVFWFHPLAWSLERRLAACAEQATDEAALVATGDPRRYAGTLLEFAAALKTSGSRLTHPGVAMARSPKISRRIERILDLPKIGSGVIRRGLWVAILACALPLVYTAAALQLSQSAPERAPNPGLAQLLTEGSKLTAAEAQQLEQQLATDSEDLTARGKLISYYFANAIEHPRMEHTFWLIEHHPESELALYYSRSHMPGPSQSEHKQAKDLWLQEVSVHPRDARVLANAAQFVGLNDQFAEEDLLKRAREVEPSNPEWIKQLAELFSWSIARWLLGPQIPAVPGAEQGFAAAAKAELESSADAALVGTVGEFLANGPPAGRRPAQAQSAYAEHLLQRAQALEPINPEWSRALARLRESPQSAPSLFEPPPPPANGVQRIRVGAVIQQSNLLQSVSPNYPPLAMQARIQGMVRFNIIIGKDGHISNVRLVSGHPLLVSPAQEAVKQWVYRPTLLNGDPVEVATMVDVPFLLPHDN